MKIKGLIALLAFAFLGSQIFANDLVLFGTVGHGGTGGSELVIIDQNTGAVEQTIGPIGYIINGLAYDPTTGTLYGTTSWKDPIAQTSLITIDTKTGAGTLVAPFASNYQGIVCLTCNSLGQLYGWIENGSYPGNNDDLASIDKQTGAVTFIGESGLITAEQSLDFNRSDILYLLNFNQEIYTISTATGLPTSSFTGTYTLAHHGKFHPITQQVWAIDEVSNTNPRNIVIIDISTGGVINTLPTIDNLHTLAFAYNVPPHSLTGVQKSNKSLLETEYFNELNFRLIDPVEASGFRIYRNRQLIAELPPTANKYIDHNQKRKKPIEYTVEVVFADGSTSQPQSVIVQ